MMGVGHALLGTTTWAAGASLILPYAGLEPTPAVIVLGAFPIAGAALRPDIDHPQASIANSGGFVTRGIAHVANALSGGHREGTHRLLFWFACALFDVAVVLMAGSIGALVLFFVYTAFGAQALAKTQLYARMNRKWRSHTGIFAKLWCWAVAAAVTAAGAYVFPLGDAANWWWLPVALTVGHATHLIGDALTTQGWEYANGHTLRFPILGDAGSSRETILTAVLGVLTVVFLAASVTGWDVIGYTRDTLWPHLSGIFGGNDTGGGGWRLP